MRSGGKIIALIISLLVISIAAFNFVINIKNVSISRDSNQFSAFDIMDTSKVFTNQLGFPHIISNSENDMFFSIGFVHAKERLWQMDYSRRAGRGELSEIFGADALPYDQFIRSINITNAAHETYKILSTKSKNILEAYTKGVNYYIETHPNQLSFEFGALDYSPKKWTIEDCLIIGKMLAFQLSSAFYYDVAMGEMANAFGIEKAKQLIPSYPYDAPFVLDDAMKTRDYTIASKDTIRKDTLKIDTNKVQTTALNGLSDYIYAMRKYINIEGSSIGSNSWARKKSKEKGAAILANDPHLPFALPNHWLPMHTTCPNYNVIGTMIPGIPLFITGRNNDISWGITNMMLDDCDFFVEKLDKNSKYYFDSDSVKKEIIYVTDTIKVKNGIDKVYYKRFTSRGQIISDAHIFNEYSKKYNRYVTNKYLQKNAITFQWTASIPNDDMLALYDINKSKDWSEFNKGTNNWSAPALNFTYCDANGNIGIAPSGFVPRREANCKPSFPNYCSEKNNQWLGVTKNNAFPKIYNPSKGFVASANNKLSSSPDYITNSWEPSSRSERIEELILASDEYSTRDAQYMQNDYYSMYAKKHFTYIIPIFENYKKLLKGNELKAYKLLKNWDFIMTQNSVGSSIYNAFVERMIYNTFFDDLGEGYYRKYLLSSSYPLRKLMEISADPRNIWFDDQRTGKKEMRDYIVVKSFKDAIAHLTKEFGTSNTKKWLWGDIHKLTLKHNFSKDQFIKPSVTIGPLRLGGNSTCINNTEHNLTKPYEVVIGSSVRFISDMSENNVYFSMPGGISGDPLSPNYSNLVQIWLNGGYLKIPFEKTVSLGFDLNTIIAPKI